MKPLEGSDFFCIETNLIFFDIDRKCILFLYQPLIKSVSVVLYFFLIELSQMADNSFKHSIILENCRINLSEFMLARRRLESFGLLRTFYNENDKKYTFTLYPPLTPQSFLKKKIFKKKISTLVSEENIKIFSTLIGLERKRNLKGIDVSSSLDESVFLNEKLNEISKSDKFSRIKLETHFINYD